MEEQIFKEDRTAKYRRRFIKHQPQTAKIREAIPLMISNQGHIVCIPKTKDTPTIGIFGSRRSGKTLILHGIADRIYHYLNQSCFIANDYMSESLKWNKPQRNLKFNSKISIVGEKPMPLPIVHLYPNSTDFIKPDEKEIRWFKIALAYDVFIENLGDFYDLERAEAYYMEIRKDLLQITDNYEFNIRRVIDEKIHKKSDLMKRKLLSRLLNMINDKFVDTGQEDVISKIRIKEDGKDIGEYPPIIALMAGKLIPILMTNQIYGKDRFFPAYFARILTDIFYDQIREGGYAFKRKKVTNIFIDELHTLVSRRRSTPAKDILDKCVAQSGPARIGFIYCDQNYSEVPHIMRDNTKYVICLQMGSKKETDEIANNFNLPKSVSREIRSLDKDKQECIVITSEKFLVYDIKNNKVTLEEGSIAGTFLPPLSHCLPPVMDVERGE